MADEPTVGQAFQELRQLFPHYLIKITINDHPSDGGQWWSVQVGFEFKGATLGAAMQQVRQWHKEQT